MVQNSHHAIKKRAIPNVMFKSALAGRKSGRVTASRGSGTPALRPKPIVPTPGTKPNQFAARIKINSVPSSEKTLGIMCFPTMPSKVTYRVSTTASNRFWIPLGIRVIFAVDRRAQITTRIVTITVTNIELVNQLAFWLKEFAVTVSSSASKYVTSIGISRTSDRDTPPATRRIGGSKLERWRVEHHESNGHGDMQVVL